jgi:hypothetical protein
MQLFVCYIRPLEPRLKILNFKIQDIIGVEEGGAVETLLFQGILRKKTPIISKIY